MQREVAKRNLQRGHDLVEFLQRPGAGSGVAAEGAGQRARGDEVSRGLRREPPRGVSPNREPAGSGYAGRFPALCECCNQIGELAGTMGFTAGLHNHMGQMVQTREEIDRFMAGTDAKLFGFSPDTAHLNLAGCDVVGDAGTIQAPHAFSGLQGLEMDHTTEDLVQPNGKVLPKDSDAAKFFPQHLRPGRWAGRFSGLPPGAEERELSGWICVDLDTARNGPRADYLHCGDYIVKKLQPIYL